MFRYAGGMMVTPGSRWTPERAVVPPGTTLQGAPESAAARAPGLPSRSSRPYATRSRAARMGPSRKSRIPGMRKPSRMPAFTQLLTRQPPAAVGSGSAARTSPASRAATSRAMTSVATLVQLRAGRLAGRRPAVGERRHVLPEPGSDDRQQLGHAATRVEVLGVADVGSSAVGSSPSAVDHAEQAGSLLIRERQQRLTQDILDEAHLRQRGLHGHRVGADEVDAHQVQQSLVERSCAVPVASTRQGTQPRHLGGDLVGGHGDDPITTEGQQRVRPGIVARTAPRTRRAGRAGWS